MFKKILIANRGEIACRIIKTAKRLNIKTVAVYSTADANSLHVLMADEAVFIGESQASESYLNIEKIIAAALETNATAIHPGFGFLSENPKFAKACSKANIVFIGPSIKAMQAMASKQVAKQILADTEVPLVSGFHGNEQTDEFLLEQSLKIGFPILLKAAAGGGGKGMRVVANKEEFKPALESAKREAMAAFSDDTMIIEQYLINPRHIEVQIMADNFGHIVHLFTRDCSIQRRHQKIIEEASAPNLSNKLLERLANAAIKVGKKINYLNAGTIEFLVDENEKFYFLEMNTRLQVEHPVTEMITGIDLVEWQLKIANNEPLPLLQQEIKCHGHAIECRIYAEDPLNDFMPSTGVITFLHEPHGENIRIDTGVAKNSNISMYYDPMIAKLITFGEDRNQALELMQKALSNYHIGGIKNNLQFLKAILDTKEFQTATATTNFLNQEQLNINTPDKTLALCMASACNYLTIVPQQNSLYREAFGWQMHLVSTWEDFFKIDNIKFTIKVAPIALDKIKLQIGEAEFIYNIQLQENILYLDDGEQIFKNLVEFKKNSYVFYNENGVIAVEKYQHQALENAAENKLTAPMPATIVAIIIQKGDRVQTGDDLIVLEAMKMEHTIKAPFNGIIIDVFHEVGSIVAEGTKLVAMENDNNVKTIS